MSDNPSAGNKNTPGLPRVGIGDPIKPSHINGLAAAIAAKGITSGHGTISQQTPNGAIVSFSQTHPVVHPWRCFPRGDRMFITLGQFYIDSPMAGGVQLSNNAKHLGGGCNAWHFNSGLPYATGYYGPDFGNYPVPNGYHMGGAELWFDDPDANYVSSKQIFYGMDPFHTKLKVGLYYIEYSVWGGRQLQAANAAFNAVTEIFNQYSTAMKGRLVPQLKYATQAEMVTKKSLIYPVCTVDESFSIFQGISSDIFHRGSTFTPLKVYLTIEGQQWKAYVTPGTVNRMPPKMNGVYIDAPTTPSKTISGEGYICIKATYQGNTFFPRESEVVFVTGYPPNDTVDTSHYPLAKINPVAGTNGYSVQQVSEGNLVINRIKAGSNMASWQWGTV